VKADLARWGNYEVGKRSVDAALEADRFKHASAIAHPIHSTAGSMPAQSALGRAFRDPMPEPKMDVASRVRDFYSRNPQTGEVMTPNSASAPYAAQEKPAVKLGPNKVTEPAPNPEAYPSKLEKAKKLKSPNTHE